MDANWNPFVDSFSGKMGDLVAYRRNGRNFVRKRARRNGEPTEHQKLMAVTFSRVARLWKRIGGILHDSWNEYSHAHDKTISGYTCFVAANVKRCRDGNALELFKSFGEESVLSFSAEPGNMGEAVCSFELRPESAGRHVTVFAQKKELDPEESVENEEVFRFDAGIDPVSPYTIDGLEPGTAYFLYAVVSDLVYYEATTVSASVACHVELPEA